MGRGQVEHPMLEGGRDGKSSRVPGVQRPRDAFKAPNLHIHIERGRQEGLGPLAPWFDHLCDINEKRGAVIINERRVAEASDLRMKAQ